MMIVCDGQTMSRHLLRITALFVVAVCLADCRSLSAEASTSEIARGKTSDDVEYGVWNRVDDGPAPVLFVLASTIDETLGSAYFRQCGNELAEHGWVCVSIDLPCHGTQSVEREPAGLNGWSDLAAQKRDFVAEANQRLSHVLDHLIKTGVADPERVAACGTSRGGFLAIHFAAHDERVQCAAGFAPVTDLEALREFRAIADSPFVAGLSLKSRAEKLAGRPVWIVIGDQDERVGTDRAVAFAQKLTAASRAKKQKSRVEIIVVPEPRGHTTPPGSSKRAAAWILNQFRNPDVQQQSSQREAGGHERLFEETDAVTLFAFDDVSIPFTQNLKLEMNSPQRHPNNPILARGPDGSCDSWAVQFYGSVLRDRDSGRFRMWYVAVSKAERLNPDTPRSVPWRVAYAESDDGIHWTKPDLGLVDSGGSRKNNLVKLDPPLGIINLKVLHEPDDPDPDRRYKMGAHVWFPKNKVRLGTFAPYVSRHGLNWKLAIDSTPVDAELPPKDSLIPPLHFEPVGGLYKWDGLYHLSGQNAIAAARPFHGRVVRSFVSPDFVNWSQSSAISFVRVQQHKLLGPGRSREGEQNHEAISVWNRGNVLLGVSGRWHGAKEWKDVTVDLGLVLSNDGLRFREPLHEWTFLKRGPDGEWDQGGLLQGQGFENVGSQTLIYYGAWDPRNWQDAPPRGGVGVATLPRDRFGSLVVDKTTEGSGNYQMEKTVSEFMTSAISLRESAGHRFYVNADGLGDDATLKVELLNRNTTPIPDYSGSNAAIVKTSGFQTPITWNGRDELRELPDSVRMRVTFEGSKNTDIRFHALYLR